MGLVEAIFTILSELVLGGGGGSSVRSVSFLSRTGTTLCLMPPPAVTRVCFGSCTDSFRGCDDCDVWCCSKG